MCDTLLATGDEGAARGEEEWCASRLYVPSPSVFDPPRACQEHPQCAHSVSATKGATSMRSERKSMTDAKDAWRTRTHKMSRAHRVRGQQGERRVSGWG